MKTMTQRKTCGNALSLLMGPSPGHVSWAPLKGNGPGWTGTDLSEGCSSLPGRRTTPQKALAMCDALVGTWKLVSSENFDDYMKEVGKDVHWGRPGLGLLRQGEGAPSCFSC